ncbi:MAG TPA: hypothetical protein VHM70_15240 [Polyangiaceae bacterium]|jgi:tetratricopeptide (TPR) repeat protein|nr:hypothetical protein [Polyangiaceae bacterium]
MPLRLTAARGGVGIELYETWSAGPLQLSELEWTLPGLAFPVDLSGGVREFRHRRGQLQHVRLDFELNALARWLNRRWRHALGGLSAPVAVWGLPSGVGVGVQGQAGVLAFDCLWAPDGERARWVVSSPRGVLDTGALPIISIMTLLDSAIAKFGTRRGRIVELADAAYKLLSEFLPPLGVRVPDTRGTWWSEMLVQNERASVRLGTTPRAGALGIAAVRQLELAQLIIEADDALVAGKSEDARNGYLEALERAPRHPELCLSVAAIDKDYAERAEAALGLLVESLPATTFGLVGAELLVEVGDEAGAELAIAQFAAQESFAPVAARAWLRLSERCSEPLRKLQALDRALGCSPRDVRARRARFQLRQHQGDVNGALADAEQLEALEQGSLNKHRVLLEAARVLEASGYVGPARRLFERALRYHPTDPVATLGLAKAFAREGNAGRGLVLLQRSAQRCTDEDPAYSEIQLELGRALAQTVGDYAAAIARVRRVNGAPQFVVEARLLEARWRIVLGDVAGANIAFARMREAIELAQLPDVGWAQWLHEAGAWSRQNGELRVAERYLALAERVRPNLPGVRRELRAVANELTERGRAEKSPGHAFESVQSDAPAELVDDAHETSEALEQPVDPEERAERLKSEFLARGRLDDDDFATLLDDLLQLGRGTELLALMLGRYEDAQGVERDDLRHELMQVLTRLAEQAERSGASDDAGLYRMQLDVVSRERS